MNPDADGVNALQESCCVCDRAASPAPLVPEVFVPFPFPLGIWRSLWKLWAVTQRCASAWMRMTQKQCRCGCQWMRSCGWSEWARLFCAAVWNNECVGEQVTFLHVLYILRWRLNKNSGAAAHGDVFCSSPLYQDVMIWRLNITKFIQVWNSLRESKRWQNFPFWLVCPMLEKHVKIC